MKSRFSAFGVELFGSDAFIRGDHFPSSSEPGGARRPVNADPSVPQLSFC